MPNWTYNRLKVEGDPPELKAFVDAVMGEEREDNGEPFVLSFERHLPTPPEALEDGGSPEERRFPDWFAWRREHWGTKWDAHWPRVVEAQLDEGSITYSFATAWRPPDAWLAFVSAAHSELAFRLEYCDEMAHFAGRGFWQAGSLTDHEELDPDEVDWMEWEEEEE